MSYAFDPQTMPRPDPIWIRKKGGLAFADIPTRPGSRMPDFCITGAAKCATTALFAMLAKQPGIHMCPLKEPQYFATPALLARGDDWYRGLFADARPDEICGEASTAYTRYPLVDGTAARMAAANPDMRLIYLVREPVARTESEALQCMKYAQAVLGEDHTHMALDDFYHMIEQPTHPYYAAAFHSSCYAEQIAAFDACFPRDQMLILQQDDLRLRPAQTLGRVLDFIGADAARAHLAAQRRNETAHWKDGVIRIEKTARLRSLPFYDVARRLMPDRLKSVILDAMPDAHVTNRLRFSDALRGELRDRFRPFNRRLAERIGPLPDGWHL